MKKKGSLLVVEDDRLTLESLIFSFTGEIGGATDVYGARTVNRALEVVRSSEPEVVVLDLSLEDDGGVAGGLKLLGIIKEQLPLCRVIVCTGCEEALYGGECLLKGAAHFVSKPVEMGILITLVRDSFYQVELHRIRKSREGTSSSCIIGSSAQARRLEESLIFAASIPHSVLLIGETGVGKSYCAKIIHEESNRASYPFIKYLTGMQSADLAGSALFGHKKGAFTGATEDRLGAFGQAGQGTLLIDDIDLLPVDIQGLLLGVLDDNEYTPIGGTKREGLECRIVTATNRDIEALLTSQLLRKDFYYRVSQLIVSIPPLRERREDIPEIARAFLGTLS